ncbi:MAG: hypothetical protein IPN94_04175 [Sphingobacteriales bacterium]|nr:hypothetical protein [Sphingobacteriales bacterium]
MLSTPDGSYLLCVAELKSYDDTLGVYRADVVACAKLHGLTNPTASHVHKQAP